MRSFNSAQSFPDDHDARGVTNPVSPSPGVIEGKFKELGRGSSGGLILTEGEFLQRKLSRLINACYLAPSHQAVATQQYRVSVAL